MRFYLYLLVCLGLVHGGRAQSRSLAITRLDAVVDTVAHRLIIHYDLPGQATDSVQVTLSVSLPADTASVIAGERLNGDVGYPIKPGKNKIIYWYYRLPLLSLPDYLLRLTVRYNTTSMIRSLVGQVDSDRLRATLNLVSGNRYFGNEQGLQHLSAIKDTLQNRFNQYGLQTRRQENKFGNYLAHNIIGNLPGQPADKQTIVLCAHFDAVANSPGADDNASGVAGLLEAIRLLSTISFRHSIQVIGFDLEEAGGMGSNRYLQAGLVPGTKIKGVVNLDMIGYTSNKPKSQDVPEGFDNLFPEAYQHLVKNGFRGNFIISSANDASVTLNKQFATCAATYAPGLSFVTLNGPGKLPMTLSLGDHANFWQAGYPAIHVGDGSFTRNKNIDSRGDRLKHVNVEFMQQVVKAVVATVATIADIVPTYSAVCQPMAFAQQ